LEDDKDAATEMSEDSPRLEWWEKAERKAEEEDEMLEEQEALLESFATVCKEERTRAATAQAVRAESSPHGCGRVLAYPQFPIGRLAEVACIWKDAAERRKAFERNDFKYKKRVRYYLTETVLGFLTVGDVSSNTRFLPY
jgi:hypothetical protein